MTNIKNNFGDTSDGPTSGSSSSAQKKTHCIPPFYPHITSHRDVWALSDSADGRIYMVKRGRGTGFFTDSDDANLQTDGFGNSAQQSFKRWDLARNGWDSFCDTDHRGQCPNFTLAAGFAAAYPTPSADRPPAMPIPISVPSPIFPAPASPSTPTLANSRCVASPLSPTSTVTSSAPGSPLAALVWGSQAPVSPSPLSPGPATSSARPRVTLMTRINLNPSLLSASTAAAAPSASTSAGTSTSSVPASPTRYWVAEGLSLIFTSRAAALTELRNVRMSGGSIMVSTDFDDLERMIFGRPATAPSASQPGGGFATRYWAVSGESRIFASRVDAVEALHRATARNAMMMVSEDLDALEIFMDEHGIQQTIAQPAPVVPQPFPLGSARRALLMAWFDDYQAAFATHRLHQFWPRLYAEYWQNFSWQHPLTEEPEEGDVIEGEAYTLSPGDLWRRADTKRGVEVKIRAFMAYCRARAARGMRVGA
ncbi:hypothetical protein FB451DRAFT_1398367 [Mycena latifolia]|nr:hypothetical protein FB451DRAFT_1398367 [Mycena latifolia]